MKCKVLPPRGLHIPVLPYRSSNKLFVVLVQRADIRRNVNIMMIRELLLGHGSLKKLKWPLKKDIKYYEYTKYGILTTLHNTIR